MIVVDASVAIKWFLIEPETPEAVHVVDRILRSTEVFVVPELFYYEVFAVVARKHQSPPKWAKEGMPWLLNLPLCIREGSVGMVLTQGMKLWMM